MVGNNVIQKCFEVSIKPTAYSACLTHEESAGGDGEGLPCWVNFILQKYKSAILKCILSLMVGWILPL